MSVTHTHDRRATMFGLAHRPAHYLRLTDHLAGRFYRRVVADVTAEAAAGRLTDEARVLDAGTGPGTVPLLLAAALPRLTVDAVDLAPQMIATATERGLVAGSPVTFAVADVGALPFADATFDLVISTASQHHWSDPEACFRDLLRVLRPGAEAWIYDFRPALRRAEVAALRAAVAFAASTSTPTSTPGGPVVVRRDSRLPGTHRLYPIGRLVVRREHSATGLG